jgi:hypothetical protein
MSKAPENTEPQFSGVQNIRLAMNSITKLYLSSSDILTTIRKSRTSQTTSSTLYNITYNKTVPFIASLSTVN